MPEIESDILSEVIDGERYHKKVPQFGERAWVAEGKEFDVVYWDTGNGWCDILVVIPKECLSCKEKLVKFYERLQKSIARHYDEDMCRVD